MRPTGGLSLNRFLCHCHENHTATMHWLRHTDVTIINYDRLTCLGHNDEELISEKNWNDYRKACSILDEVVVTAVVSVLSTAAFVGLLKCIMTAFRHRYTLKTYFYKLRLARICSLHIGKYLKKLHFIKKTGEKGSINSYKKLLFDITHTQA